MNQVTDRADLELTRVFVPASFSEIHRELVAAVGDFRAAARSDLEGRDAENVELLEKAQQLAEQGNARFEKVTAMLQRIAGFH